jgi:hypothetical protein
MTYLVCSLTYHNNNIISITEITDCRDIYLTSENKHMKGAQTWMLEKEGNVERRERLYPQTKAFYCEQRYALAWNTITYGLMQCDSLSEQLPENGQVGVKHAVVEVF